MKALGHPPALPAIAVGLATLAFALATAGSDVGTWDVAENQTVPYILGIAHPTGFPAFTLAGWVFSHAFAVGTVAWRLNVFSGVWMAIAAGGVVLLSELLGADFPEAVLAGITFVLGTEAWREATHADVHAMLLACIVFALVFALRAVRGGGSRDAVAAALCAGVGLATHPLALFALPAVLIALAMRPDRRSIVPAVAVLLAPLLLYLYFPLRSTYIAAHGLDPTAGAPLFGAGTIAWDTEHPRTLAGFIAEVTGRQFDASQHLAGAFSPQHYAADLQRVWALVPSEMPVWLLPFALLGLIAVALRRPAAAAAVLVTALGIVAFGASVFNDHQDLARYLLPVFALAIALATAAARLPIPRVTVDVRRAVVVLALAVAAGTAWRTNPGVSGRHDDPAGRLAIETVRAAVPDGALVVAPWADATALAYASFVEHSLGTRTVVLGWPSDFSDAYARWTPTRRVVLLLNVYGAGNLQRSDVPRPWLHELPSPNRHFRIVEIRP